VGDHTVIFAGRDEVIEINHHAASREIFANGAVKAAKFLTTVTAPGIYDMSALI
jgi:4-hydroxy-tetrahydrodipicolinate reductase